MGVFIINCVDDMIRAVRHFGIIPLFRGGISGWSIEEMTPREHWFTTSDDLGPWDWKVDVVREGDIAYGKFIGGKASFATVEFYAHLMNWRRSLPRYRMALGEKYVAKTRSDKLMKVLSPSALEVIKTNGSADSALIRQATSKAVTPALIRSLGAGYKANLVPSVKKGINDTVVAFLEMGTWSVVGDITRVYRGPNAEYHGWQRSSHTTPDALFGVGRQSSQSPAGDAPFWARFIDNDAAPVRDPLAVDCTPEESREYIIRHVMGFFPDEPDIYKKLEKII